MYRPLRAVVDLTAVQHNLRHLRAVAPGDRFLGIVKADGYGHGSVRVARVLAPEVDGLGVASLDEAVTLREAGVPGRLLLLEGVFTAEEQREAARHGLDLVVHQDYQVDLLEQGPETRHDVWLKVDTGMCRLGFPPPEVPQQLQRLRACARAGEVRLMTHLACADDRRDDSTPEQIRLFHQTRGDSGLEFSIANSAATLDWEQARGGWSRPGIALYGISPFTGGTGETLGLRPSMRLETRLIAVNRARRGAAIGYGNGWVCPEDMPVGVAAIGYGDGYPRHVPSGTAVLVNGAPASVVGRVSMDMITVDLRTQPQARPGDPVLLWGPGLPVEEVARAAGTIGYELVTGLTPRVPRVEA